MRDGQSGEADEDHLQRACVDGGVVEGVEGDRRGGGGGQGREGRGAGELPGRELEHLSRTDHVAGRVEDAEVDGEGGERGREDGQRGGGGGLGDRGGRDRRGPACKAAASGGGEEDEEVGGRRRRRRASRGLNKDASARDEKKEGKKKTQTMAAESATGRGERRRGAIDFALTSATPTTSAGSQRATACPVRTPRLGCAAAYKSLS